MPLSLLHPLMALIFAVMLVVLVPRSEIRKYAVYGVIFGGLLDVIMLTVGYLTGFFRWTNIGPFGYLYIPFSSPVAWTIFFILFFYFLPREKVMLYLFVAAAIGMAILFTNLVTNLGIFTVAGNRLLTPLIIYSIWIGLSTWGYMKLRRYLHREL